MIPFRDNIPSRTYPVVTILLITTNILVFLYQLSIPENLLQEFFLMNGFVPAQISGESMGLAASVGLAGSSLLTSMFLHGGWFHLLGNMWYLWIFGDNIEDRMGHLRFLVFYLVGGLAAGFAHYMFNLDSTLPSIGASGAVAAVLGAYLVSYPFARVVTIIPLLFVWPIIDLPALAVLGFWILVQLINGLMTDPATQITGGVAWWAHIGGFLTGMILVGLFAKPIVRRYTWED